MIDICEYCDGAGTVGPLTTFDKILEICVRKNSKFLNLGPTSYIIEIEREWIQLSSTELTFKRRCPKCLGDGRLDWVERIVGKRMENVKDVAA
jgi:hypothetical protein